MSQILVDRARSGDGEAFAELVEPHRRELQVHCYRMLGSLQDAEDVLQETLLAAWAGIGGFEGRSSVRTWLYRIATHRCLNHVRSAARRPATVADPSTPLPGPSELGEVPWLQPYPDVLLEGLPDPAPGPEARYDSVEAISLAFITALQLLPPNQRAVLLMRDVLGYRAAETAELLGLTVDAVTSALARARAGVRARRRSTRPPDQLGSESPAVESGIEPGVGSAEEQALTDRFVTAFTSGSVPELVELFTDDVWLRMPPLPWEYRGKAAAARFLEAIAGHRSAVARMVPIRANRQPGWGEYVRDPATGLLRLVGVLLVAACSDAGIHEVTRFETSVAPSLGLPRTWGDRDD